MTASTMLEIVLPRINQNYEIESKRVDITYAGETIKINPGVGIPVGIFIKISDSKFNSGYYKIIDRLKGGYHLDRIVTKGTETAVITLLAIPAGLDTIIGQMAKYAKETADNQFKSERFDDYSYTRNDEDVFKKFSGMLGSYRRLKSL